MSVYQISAFISTGVEPLIYYDNNGNKHLQLDASGNPLCIIQDINNKINSVLTSLPVGAKYINHTMTTYSFNTPPVLLLTIFYEV